MLLSTCMGVQSSRSVHVRPLQTGCFCPPPGEGGSRKFAEKFLIGDDKVLRTEWATKWEEGLITADNFQSQS